MTHSATARCVAWGDVGDRSGEEMVYAGLQPVGGTVSAEHGIGLEKLDYIRYSRSDAELATMRSLKQALDPLGLLNPGRVLARAG